VAKVRVPRPVRRAFGAWRATLADRPTRVYTVAALAISAALLALAFIWHTLFYFDQTSTPLPATLTPWLDDSIPEYVEAILTLAGAAFLARAAWLKRDGLLAAWSLTLVVLAADNRLRLHESAGHVLAPLLDPFSAGPITGRHLGELAFWFACGIVLSIAFVLGWRTRTTVGADATIVLSIVIVVLLHFAGGYDLLHVLTRSNLVGFVEDGGEMLCVAAASAYAFSVVRRVMLADETSSAIIHPAVRGAPSRA
jgi:hypothetical protein